MSAKEHVSSRVKQIGSLISSLSYRDMQQFARILASKLAEEGKSSAAVAEMSEALLRAADEIAECKGKDHTVYRGGA